MRLTKSRLALIKQLAADIDSAAQRIGRPVRVMEVCGTHAHAVGRFGLRQLLPESVELISGPGCPVCVTTAGQIALGIELACRGVTVATFGDMLPVPAGDSSLAAARASGAPIQVVYSPQQALELAEQTGREVAFLAVGFETTAPAVAAVVAQAAERRVRSFSVLPLHKLIPPALRALVADAEVAVDGFLCPGHVSVIIGSNAYRPLAEELGMPCVVTGFEPEDILLGVKMVLGQVAERRAEVENAYPRAVRPEGNPTARALMERTFSTVSAEWRGLGTIPDSGLALRREFQWLDAASRYELEARELPEPPGCRCGDVLRGVLRPAQCPLFATACTPARPVGPCMVSSEGACAAAYKYERSPMPGGSGGIGRVQRGGEPSHDQ